MVKEYYYPTIEKTFPLEDLFVPPKKYALFLSEGVDKFVSFILDHHKCSTIEDAEEKYREKIRKLNPNKKEDELLPPPFFYFSMATDIKFLRFTSGVKRKKFARRIHEYERLFDVNSNESVRIINIDNHKKDIEKYNEDFRKILDKRYPTRKGKIPHGDNNPSIPYGFELNLSLLSFSTMLETEIILCDHGVRGDGYSIPGIKIKTKLPYGSLTAQRKITDNLEEVVKSYYAPKRQISYATSYSENLI